MNAANISGTVSMICAMLLSGTIGWAVTESGQEPLTVVFFRCAIGGAGLFFYMFVIQRRQPGWQAPTQGSWIWLVIGGAALVANWVCLFSAYRYSSISIATIVYHTQPFMLLVMAAALQKEPLEWGRMPWLLLAFCGVALTSGLHAENRSAPGMATGILLACAAAFLYAVATLATQRLKPLPPAQIAAVQMMIGMLLLFPLASPLSASFEAKSISLLAMLGLVHTAFMYTLMYGAFQKLPAHAIAALSFVYPVAALAVDMLVYGVRLAPMQWLGVGLILLALFAHQRKWSVTGPSRAQREPVN